MAATYKTPGERIAARQRAKAAKIATQQAKSAAYYRAQAEKIRLADSKWFALEGPTPTEMAADYEHRAEGLEQKLASSGRCVRCGRALTDPKSVAGSIGPECARKGR
jgi:hypothetical protein